MRPVADPIVATRERPILFSGPMVRAIFEGRKTQTRRVITPQPHPCHGAFAWASPKARAPGSGYGGTLTQQELAGRSPYGAPGDRLWVRETWRAHPESGLPEYRADDDFDGVRWSPSIFMPRWASRIDLVVVSVHVERLKDITAADAMAEGAHRRDAELDAYGQERAGWSMRCPHPIDDDPIRGWEQCLGTARFAFGNGWDQINGKRAPWDSNPWVWVVEFRRTPPCK
jgi:hypothetical protein